MLVLIIYYSFMMLVVLMLITFTIHTNGQWESRSLSLTTAIMDYLNQNRTIDSSGDIMKSILDDPVLFPSIITKLAQENRTTILLQYLSKHASLELFKSLVVLDDYSRDDAQGIHDAWKYLRFLNINGPNHLIHINGQNKNESNKLHITMETSKKFMVQLNYNNQELTSGKDVMQWSHIPSFITSLTVVYYTGFGRAINGNIDIDLTSFDPSCNLNTLVISFTKGWIHFPDYSFPSSLTNLAITGGMIDYQRLWKIGRSIKRLEFTGMGMSLADFDGFENMIHLNELYVEMFPAHKILWLKAKLKKLFLNSARTEPTIVFSCGDDNMRVRMMFDISKDIKLTIFGNDERWDRCLVCWETVCTLVLCGVLIAILAYLLI
eukprot:468434_1